MSTGTECGAVDSKVCLLRSWEVHDIRYPTSLKMDGSDAMHTAPDYSIAYVILAASTGLRGYGLTFTCGRGTDIVCKAVRVLMRLFDGANLLELFADFGGTYRKLTSEDQLRWLGPEKGVMHLAAAAILNALWDLFAKLEGKPLWKLLVDMEPEQLVSCIDFRYITDALTRDEAIAMLRKKRTSQADRERWLKQHGFPAYTTGAGWLGYSDEKLRELCRTFKARGFTRFKLKVGSSLDDDQRRLRIFREELGSDAVLMTDANQKWNVDEAISWMKELAPFNILWIEEPTSPDDVLGHAAIAKALKPHGVKVATGEMCQNRVMFKQFLQAGAMDFCQIDSARVGSVNENLAVILMASKFNVPVCPHAGGLGLCELVQHYSMWDYVSVTGLSSDRVLEYVDHLHELMVHPVKILNGTAYSPPEAPGFSSELEPSAVNNFRYPDGVEWKRLISENPAQYAPWD